MAGYNVIAYITWVAKWPHSTFFLILVSCIIIWYRNIRFQTQMENFNGETRLCKFALYLSSVPFRKVSTTKLFLWTFSHPYFIENAITINISHVRFVHHVLCVHYTFQIQLQFLDPQSDHQVLLNLFLGLQFPQCLYFRYIWIEFHVFQSVLCILIQEHDGRTALSEWFTCIHIFVIE